MISDIDIIKQAKHFSKTSVFNYNTTLKYLNIAKKYCEDINELVKFYNMFLYANNRLKNLKFNELINACFEEE